MQKSENINLDKVEEMAEGDIDFKAELLHALYTSVQDLQIKYLEGLRSQDEEVLQQARHKIKPTVTLFQLKKIHSVLSEGKTIISTTGFAVLDQHEREFVQVTDDLLRELEGEMS
jgi:hypothetical protein